ncbi:PREDICTED: intelectin-like protein [Acropora digitifera]|uniref:intelectin-like protein n=1 Tax=Acropora digitifera TaxID=70779 RepID=UPI00077A4D83|nr:PREDICTED: intelectin-like protein [Acropora digitifera]
MEKFRKRTAIGSISQVPAESCNEIKTSEKGRNGKYWLSSIIPGTPVLAYCDMNTGDVDECTASTPVCGLQFNCNNTLGSYRCKYNHSCCQGILDYGKQNNLNPSDGLYTLSTNSTLFQVYCDMTSSGQAWTLIARFSNNDAKN